MGIDFRNQYDSFKLRLQALWAVSILSLTAEGRRAWRFLRKVDQVYEKLLSEQRQQYQGEFSFLQFIRTIVARDNYILNR